MSNPNVGVLDLRADAVSLREFAAQKRLSLEAGAEACLGAWWLWEGPGLRRLATRMTKG